MGNLTPSPGGYGRAQYYQNPYGPQRGPFGVPQSGPPEGQQLGTFVRPPHSSVDQQPYDTNPVYFGGHPQMTPQPAYTQPPHAFEQQSYPPYPQQGYPYQSYPPQWGRQEGYPQQGYQQGLRNAAGCAACMACITCLLCSCCQGMMGAGMHGMNGMSQEHGTTPVTAPQTDALDADDN